MPRLRQHKGHLVFRSCNMREGMDLPIKEGKNSFKLGHLISREMVTNEYRLLISAIAYNLFNCFRRMALPEGMRDMDARTVRECLFAIPAIVVRHARKVTYALTRVSPILGKFREVLTKVSRLPVTRSA